MNSHKISLKLYARPGTVPDAARFVEVFHDWIKDGVLAETMIDVVDYGHVHHGPAVLFVGHESDYALDLSEGRPGLYYQRKRAPAEVPERRLDDAFARLFRVAELLTADSRLSPLAFDSSEVLLRVLDRLNVPNEEASYERELAGIVKSASERLGGGVEVVRAAADPREPFAVRLRASVRAA